LIIIGWCTDDGGDARKMRRLLLSLMPWLIVILCWAHQINLVVGDVLGLRTLPFIDCVPPALEVVKWFNNHSRALGVLAVEQRSISNKRPLALLLPVITRWTLHYCSLRRLLEVQGPMKACYNKYKAILLGCAGPTADAKRKAVEIQNIVENPSFWEKVQRYVSIVFLYSSLTHQLNLHFRVKDILEPFAIAANITQGPTTRLYHVILALGNLYRIFSDPKLDDALRDGVHASLEKRWAKADQDVFIACVVMNPYIRDRCFTRAIPELTCVGLYVIVKRVSERILRKPMGNAFYEAFMDYLQESNEFSSAWMQLNTLSELAKANVSGIPVMLLQHCLTSSQKQEVDLIKAWQGVSTTGSARNEIVEFAIRILSVVANSAGCERTFSDFGIIHSKRRSKLELENVRKTSTVRSEIKRAHLAAGHCPRPRKRQFAAVEDDTTSPTPSTAPSTSTTAPEPSAIPSPSTDAADIDAAGIDIVDFEEVAQDLIRNARESDIPDVLEDDSHELPPASSICSSLPSTSLSQTPAAPSNGQTAGARSSASKKTSIPLRILFKYPGSSDPWDGLDHYWKGGIRNLDDEMVQLEEIMAANNDIDGDDSN
jgi:hypothetical protein